MVAVILGALEGAGNISLSRIVPMPCLTAMVALTAFVRLTAKVSLFSLSLSPITPMRINWLIVGMSALSSLPKTSGGKPNTKIQFQPQDFHAKPARQRAKPTAPLKPAWGSGRRQKQRITAQGPLSCETDPAPQGRYGSSSVGSSAFRAVGCSTRRRTQRSSTACRKCAEHIQAVPARQPLSLS